MEKIFHPLTQRRLRTDTHIRELTAGVKLSHKSFIQPLFADESLQHPRVVDGLTNVQVDTASSILYTIEQDLQNGISKFLLFPVPATKQVQQFDFSFAVSLIQSIKQKFGHDVWLAADLCLCSYTTHGHCGILNEAETKLINYKTVELLVKYASQVAAAGVDCIAPSDMMDGRIAAIRSQLDALGFDDVSIMSYAAKFSSQFYGPFRDACHSSPNSNGLQNRRTYQISPFNLNDAVASALRDEQEGADILMVKPAALYTDVIHTLKNKSVKPVAAYHVSGEYASIELLVAKGFAQREKAHTEVWAALQRAGADIIISYAARNAKEWIEQIEY
jgi:porphobilinogen synthase